MPLLNLWSSVPYYYCRIYQHRFDCKVVGTEHIVYPVTFFIVDFSEDSCSFNMIWEVILGSMFDEEWFETLDALALHESSSFSHVGNRYNGLDLMLHHSRDVHSNMELGHYWEHGLSMMV